MKSFNYQTFWVHKVFNMIVKWLKIYCYLTLTSESGSNRLILQNSAISLRNGISTVIVGLFITILNKTTNTNKMIAISRQNYVCVLVKLTWLDIQNVNVSFLSGYTLLDLKRRLRQQTTTQLCENRQHLKV